MRRRICAFALVALALLLAGASTAWAQQLVEWRTKPFLGRTWLEPYQCYAQRPYLPQTFRPGVRKHFDGLGNYLIEGYLQWTWEERRPGLGLGDIRREDGSYRFEETNWNYWFDYMTVSSDAYKGWKWNFAVSDDIRANFTSFTLRLPRFTGVELDLASQKNAATVLYTRGWSTWRPDVLDLPPGPVMTQAARDGRPAVSPVPVFGFHWRSEIGQAVTLGATFVNQHAESATNREFITQARGTLPHPMLPPETVLIRFTDDSPEDGTSGAAVFEVNARIIAEGDSVITRIQPQVFGGTLVGDHREANGFDEIIYAYPMPLSPIPVAMEFEAVVANDYRIAVSQEHKFFNPLTKQVDEAGNPVQFEDRATDPVVIDRSEGNVRDFSNKGRVRLRYGFNTGMTKYGFDVKAEFSGLVVEGELALSSTYQQFPTVRGERLDPMRGSAWFVNAVKSLGPRVDVGLEAFQVGPKFGGWMGTRGGTVLYNDKAGFGKNQPLTFEIPMVDDNDDRDQWSDDDITDEGISRGQFNQDAGVFPGQDEDQDGVRDDDRNENFQPDWQEPFLMYYTDPLEFVYGYDWNNNGWTDQRENDERPDYRYNKDQEGVHAFVAFRPFRGAEVAVGQFDSREIAAGNDNDLRYVRTSLVRGDPSIAEVEFRHDTKRVRDEIRDSVYEFREFPDPSGPQPGIHRSYDTLQMRNSAVNTFWLGTKYSQVLNLHVENNFKFTQNHQLTKLHRDGTEQPDVRLSQFAMANRADYVFRFGRWRLTPQFKRLTLVETAKLAGRSGVTTRSQSWTAPILKVDFRASGSTTIRFAQQGAIVGWAEVGSPVRDFASFRFRDQTSPEDSYAGSDFALIFENRVEYWGKPLVMQLGYHRRTREFTQPEARTRNLRFSRFFVEAIGGF